MGVVKKVSVRVNEQGQREHKVSETFGSSDKEYAQMLKKFESALKTDRDLPVIARKLGIASVKDKSTRQKVLLAFFFGRAVQENERKQQESIAKLQELLGSAIDADGEVNPEQMAALAAKMADAGEKKSIVPEERPSYLG